MTQNESMRSHMSALMSDAYSTNQVKAVENSGVSADTIRTWKRRHTDEANKKNVTSL